jgi:hypothetical protein
MALSKFGQAFRDARESGEKTFMFNGKEYSTRTAEEEGSSKAREASARRSADVERKRQIAEIAGRSSAGKLTPAVDAAGRGYQAAKESAAGEDAMSGYKPRYTPPMAAPKWNEGSTGSKRNLATEDTSADTDTEFKKGGKVSASRRGDGIAKRGKTRGKIY